MLKLTINGAEHELTSDPDTPLAYVLRDELRLKGTKIGCGLEQCGACTVLVDGEAVQSCATPAAVFEGREIVTIEGLTDTAEGRCVQDAFVEARAAQCGYCTAGLVVAVAALARAGAAKDREALKEALTGHLCRCGSHPRVLTAAEAVLEGQT
ncbi:(2Fe-2S)-binding protein [Aestuariicoccus sp. MJ-SS9]|uniref:(2Fe-2S)-binding protein n=1 Tax=Aestuariicoccus sp. MJ-SS9 TaxID=3079855 RepID=UPI00290B943B|nr:2Fe-2S iron-sulfur cluster-binding protein [Aestuariicoccus sp. MJ-SS9]MDU8911931.1 2Fe-2S iron-sulfur cluster-binding protein [Aestuariicoccus sp. MJ-SS9]